MQIAIVGLPGNTQLRVQHKEQYCKIFSLDRTGEHVDFIPKSVIEKDGQATNCHSRLAAINAA